MERNELRLNSTLRALLAGAAAALVVAIVQAATVRRNVEIILWHAGVTDDRLDLWMGCGRWLVGGDPRRRQLVPGAVWLGALWLTALLLLLYWRRACLEALGARVVTPRLALLAFAAVVACLLVVGAAGSFFLMLFASGVLRPPDARSNPAILPGIRWVVGFCLIWTALIGVLTTALFAYRFLQEGASLQPSLPEADTDPVART